MEPTGHSANVGGGVERRAAPERARGGGRLLMAWTFLLLLFALLGNCSGGDDPPGRADTRAEVTDAAGDVPREQDILPDTLDLGPEAEVSTEVVDAAVDIPRDGDALSDTFDLEPETDVSVGECHKHEECGDGDPCTADLCDLSGRCIHPEVGGPCDDGNPCTDADQCVSGRCLGEPVDCPDEDDDPCTVTACSATEGCVIACRDATECVAECASDDDCDDGDPGSIDQCAVGTCSSRCRRTWPSCDDGEPCTEDRPDDEGICRNLPIDGGACDDGSACTASDRCVGGVCAGVPVVCNDGNACTSDRCRPAEGCVFLELPDGLDCDDGNACTVGDVCRDRLCLGQPRQCPDDGDRCSLEYCDPGEGCRVFCRQAGDCAPQCEQDTECRDDDPCSLDRCEETTCTTHCKHHVDPCEDGVFCTLDYCDSSKGGCQHLEWCIQCTTNADCADGDACTLDRCTQDEICEEGVLRSCPDDGDPCTIESCDTAIGCTFECSGECEDTCATDAGCDDGDPCTFDHCQRGECGSFCWHEPRTCAPDRDCSISLCAAGGCISSVPAALPTLDGQVGPDWHPSSLAAVEIDPSNWEGAALEELRVQVGDNLLYVGIRGFANGPELAVVGYLDVDLGSTNGVSRLDAILPGVGELDAALSGCATIGASGFRPDFAFGSVAMSSAYGAASKAGWRRITSTGSLRWMPEGAVVADTTAGALETAVTLDALLPGGVPEQGAAMAVVVLVTTTATECAYADQSLPNQPAPLAGRAPRLLAAYRFVVQPSLVDCCTTGADCRDDDPCTSDICPPDGSCVHLDGACNP